MDEKPHIIMAESPEAATLTTVTGWVSRTGYFFGDNEWAARHEGATHRKCDQCDRVLTKGDYTQCSDCRMKNAMTAYLALPEAEWDGVNPVYSETKECYYTHPDDAYDDLWPGQGLEALCLFLTEPNYAGTLDADELWCDDLAEDDTIPDILRAAIDNVNLVITGGTVMGLAGATGCVVPPLAPLSWSATRVRLKIST